MVTHYQPLKYHGLINVPKVCVILGICLVFVVVWPEVDINISTYVQRQGPAGSQSLQLCWVAPADLRGSWLLAPGETGLLQELLQENILTFARSLTWELG